MILKDLIIKSLIKSAETISNATTPSFDIRNPHTSKWNLLFDGPLKEWMSFKPKLGLQVYPCYACRHIFRSKNSFLDHVNRRSVYIKYNCRPCTTQESLLFYNPCSFIIHVRQHFTFNGGVIDLNDLEISTLPVELAGFLPHPSIKMLYDVKDDEASNICMDSRFYSTSSECMGHRMIYFTPDEVLFFSATASNQSLSPLVLKQISTNIPRCIFVEMSQANQFPPNIPNSSPSNSGITDDTLSTDVTVKTEPLDEDEDNVEAAQSQSTYECTMPVITKVETISEPETFDSATSPTKETNEIINGYKFPSCSECKKTQRVSMADHFIQENKPFDGSIQCNVCKYVAPSTCSLMAHQRIHENLEPYVCPECGKVFVDWKFLNSHLNDVCFHLAKQVRIKCPGKKCGKVFAQNVTFSAHFASVHLQNLNKCRMCNSAFFNENEFVEHLTVHGTKEDPQKIYKCNVCMNEEAFGVNLREEHIQVHANDRANFIYVYICKYCRSYFRSNTTYATHLLRCTKNHSIASDSKSNDGKNWSVAKVNLTSAKDHVENIKIHMIVTMCSKCNVRLKFQVVNLRNMLSNCPKCGEKLYLPGKRFNIQNRELKKEEIPVLKEVPELSKTPRPPALAPLMTSFETLDLVGLSKTFGQSTISKTPEQSGCSKTSDQASETPHQFLKTPSQGTETLNQSSRTPDRTSKAPDSSNPFKIPKVPPLPKTPQHAVSIDNKCLLCNAVFTNTTGHENACKYSNPMIILHRISSSEKDRESSTSPKLENNGKRKRKRYNYTALTNKHKKLLASENFPEFQVDEPLPFDGIYHCKLCQFSHKDRSEFHDHILKHRLISTSYQCMECGECFVVKPSLAKHLQFYHQIFDLESYFKENNCFDKEAVKELEQSMKLVPGEKKVQVKDNQCSVCLLQFRNGLELKKHFRVHGMAFLMHMK